MMSSNNAKKRRAGLGGGDDAPPENSNGLVHEELKMISSHMTSMMNMMSSMKGEITRLTEKCDRMEKSIEVMKESQNNIQVIQNTISENNMNSRFDGVEDKLDCHKLLKNANQIIEVTQSTISDNMNSRFDDMDNKQMYHEILLKNQQWKYSAPRPSEEYWHTVDVAGAAENFLKDIQQNTEGMRYGTGGETCDGIIILSAFLQYDVEFLPHWKEFADALKQYQYCLKCLPKDSDTELALFSMELPDTVIDLLSKALESTHFTRFYLGNNNLGQSGIEFALKYVKNNHILKKFCLYNNTMNNMKYIKQLCQIVEEHPSIDQLDLGGCCGEEVDGYETLQMIMSAGKNKELKMVDLSNNNISTGGDTFISDFLAGNFVLNKLDLSSNQLDDKDAIAIAGALEHNTNLRDLDLLDNNISKEGWEALRKAEFDDTSLNSAADSNHTCTIIYPDELDISEMNGDRDNSVVFEQTMYVRKKKIYSVLSSRNRECSNVGHFDDVPVEFLPDILKCLQQYSNYHTEEDAPPQDSHDVNPLSLVYEICRYWDKSLAVYELLSS